MFKKSILTAALLMVTVVAAHAEKTVVDAKIKHYAPAAGVAGNLGSIGSDSLNNLMTYWAEGFKKKYPNVNIQIEGKGSSTAPPALIAGTAQLEEIGSEIGELIGNTKIAAEIKGAFDAALSIEYLAKFIGSGATDGSALLASIKYGLASAEMF